MEDTFKRLVDAICAIANEFKRSNDLKTKALLAADIPVLADEPAAAVIEEAKKKSPGRPKKAAETATEAPQTSRTPVNPFEDEPTITKEMVKQALIKAAGSKGTEVQDAEGKEIPEVIARKDAALGLLKTIAGTAKFSEVKPEFFAALIEAANKLAAS